ncbi:transcriptional regulator [Streptomyces buecherae]|uniref:Transcriptional regulator n=1 Tax=Streptomyces buecherae TaxID=2763006 RepID=A0A7H8N683_9ACTN|nr:transcriptional regulator [Streptomyces buecherae]QKW49922.1 transcriptional regulator [Streptomyces buecherae]
MGTAKNYKERQANERLRALIAEADCSHSGLARQVNMCGRAHGMDLRYDKTSVSRWLRGQRPRDTVPKVIAEVLSGKLGRRVTLHEMGMAAEQDVNGAKGPQLPLSLHDALLRACALWQADAQDVSMRPKAPTSVAKTDLVTVAGLVEASRDWLITEPDRSAAHRGTRRVGVPDVAALWATTGALVDLDHRFGGGHIRPVVVHQLSGVVAELLRGEYKEAVGRRLFACAARLSELVGYMAFDTNQLMPAQCYYTQALRLAQAAGDRAFGSYVISAGLGRLALAMGNPRETVHLAKAAQEGARGDITPQIRSVQYAIEARGHALLGDRHSFQSVADRAEEALGTSVGATGDARSACDLGISFDTAYLAGERALGYQDLGQLKQALQWAEEGARAHPQARVRRRALSTLSLATMMVRSREVQAGCAVARRAMSLVKAVQSEQCVTALRGLTGALDSVGDETALREFRTTLADAPAVASSA